ncbi:MAG: sigma-70 family RNA polymerase sigma factor [Bacteroidales bacterium]|nr:sigma-70 family RNA polymerase sigma factor [Bacteroidales bacterium]
MRQLIITKQITNRQDESVNRYFLEISKFDLISAEHEAELAARIRNGDMQALEKLVKANLRFVVSVAKQYMNKGLSFPDLINEGNLGLVKAAHKFDETRGFKFISYAVWWIRQSIMQALAEQVRIVRLPLNKVAYINKIARAFPKLEQEFQREPTDEELAREVNITEKEASFNNIIKLNQISLDAPLVNSEDEYNLYDILKSGDMPAPDDELLSESLKYEINRALSKLTKREADIIRMSYGLDNQPILTLSEISCEVGISSERVRQIRKTGIEKLKRLLHKIINH